MSLSPTFRSGGIASGMDTNSMVAQLVHLEKAPIRDMQQRKRDFESQQRIYRGINSTLSATKTKAEAMDTYDEFLSLTTTSSDTNFLTASAGGDALPGNYEIVISQLAKAEKDRSTSFASSSESSGVYGTMQFTVDGDSWDVTVASGSDSLANWASEINASSAPVDASIFYDGTNYRLIVQGQDTGVDNAITIDETGLTGNFSFSEYSTAQDAQFTVDGIAVTSGSNTATDFIENVTLNLLQASAGETISLNISTDNTAIKNKVQEMLDQINNVFSTINNEMAFSGAAKGNNRLSGDSTLRTIQSRLRSLLGSSVTGLTGNYTALSQIGVTSDSSTGLLSIDTDDFNTAINSDFRGVARIFIDDTDQGTEGVAKQMADMIKEFTEATQDENGNTLKGLLEARIDGIDDSIDDLDDQIENQEMRVASYEQMLVRQFTAMEIAISQLQAQSGYMSAM